MSVYNASVTELIKRATSWPDGHEIQGVRYGDGYWDECSNSLHAYWKRQGDQ